MDLDSNIDTSLVEYEMPIGLLPNCNERSASVRMQGLNTNLLATRIQIRFTSKAAVWETQTCKLHCAFEFKRNLDSSRRSL